MKETRIEETRRNITRDVGVSKALRRSIDFTLQHPHIVNNPVQPVVDRCTTNGIQHGGQVTSKKAIENSDTAKSKRDEPPNFVLQFKRVRNKYTLNI